jgi:hypothetical protein
VSDDAPDTVQRNDEIWVAFQSGAAGIPKLAAVHGISQPRVRQIINAAAAREYLRLFPPRPAPGSRRPRETR